MKFQRLTVAGIIASTMLINTPRTQASIIPENKQATVKKNHYAYGGGLELINKIDRYEQNTSCYAPPPTRSTHYQMRINRGIALQHQQRYLESVVCFDRALSLQPKSEQAWYRCGISFSHLK